ncbi:MAG: hypothetical protein RL687_54 [Candidatus Parcubacteria bacterium]
MILIAMYLLVFGANVRIYAQDTLSHSVVYDTTYSNGKISLQKITNVRTELANFSAPTGLAYLHIADAVKAASFPFSRMEVHSYKVNYFFQVEDFVSYYSYDKYKDTWAISPEVYSKSSNHVVVMICVLMFVIIIFIFNLAVKNKLYRLLMGLAISSACLFSLVIIFSITPVSHSVGSNAEMSFLQKVIFMVYFIIFISIINFISARFEKNKKSAT